MAKSKAQRLGEAIYTFLEILFLGLALWLGKTGSFRVGLKDYYFHETRRLTASNVHDLIFHVDLGILLGGGGDS